MAKITEKQLENVVKTNKELEDTVLEIGILESKKHGLLHKVAAAPQSDNEGWPIAALVNCFTKTIGIKNLGFFRNKNFVVSRLAQSICASKVTYTTVFSRRPRLVAVDLP